MKITVISTYVLVLVFLTTLFWTNTATAQVVEHNKAGVQAGIQTGVRAGIQAGYQLTHQYTFEDGTAKDAVGNADGVVNGGSIENGIYTTQNNGDHIALPADVIAINTYQAITLEACVTVSQGLNTGFTMLSYFGNSVNNNGTDGYFISLARGDDFSRAAISCGDEAEPWGAETGVNGTELEDGQKHHIVSILDGESIGFYIDGQLVGSSPLATHNSISSLSNNLAFLCKGGYLNDPTWLGSLHEFTIYSGIVDANEIAQRANAFLNTDEGLVHSYTFEDGTAKDAVGNADGVINGGSIENGIYTTQNNGDHIALPADVIAINTYRAVTLEACVTVSQGLNTGFTMLSYFGNSVNSNGCDGYFVSLARGDNVSRAAISCGNEAAPYNAETGVNGPELEDGQKHHIVSILDGESISLYIDGQLTGSSPLATHNSISSLSNNLAFLCKGGYLNDPTWLGSLHEFNIYDTVLPITAVRKKSVAFLGMGGQPVAKAGQNVYAKPGEQVTLNGSESYDPMGNPLTYKWTAPEGIILNSDEIANPVFVAPELTSNTELLFSLVVNNGTESSEPDQVVIKVCVIPELNTYSVSNSTRTTAISGGDILFEGKSAVTAKGVCWSTNPLPTLSDEHDNQGAGAGNFSTLINGLNAETTYYVRAYASNQEGTAYGNEIHFDTQGTSPWDNLSSHLPLIKIDTYGQSIVNEPKITATMKVINQSGQLNNVNDTVYEYDGYIGIELRGNTSQWMYEKKSFGVETRLEDGQNNNVTLLGLPKENDWVLYAPYSDKTMLRNVIAYQLGNTMGNWSPRTRFCEVFVNEEYRGVYILTEKIKIDNDRVDIATLKPEDNEDDQLTGGYIMRIDRNREGSWVSPFKGWTGTSDVPISYYDPKYDELTEPQKQYIREYITAFETALAGEQFKDTTEGYRPYIDVVSFIDYMIMTELSRNLDGYRCSVYFHKDKDSNGGKLNMSPFWDYNLCFGNGNFMQAFNPSGWVVEGIGSGDGFEPVFWYEKLRQDPYYETWLKYRWNELRNTTFNQEYIYSLMDSCASLLGEAIGRNYAKFDILNQQVWPNYYVGGSYENEINYLKGWFEQRFEWLDEQIAQIVPAFDIKDGIATARSGAQVLAYPNPFTDRITFSLSLADKSGLSLIIRDLTGKTVYTKSALYDAGAHIITVSAGELPENNSFFIYSLLLEGKIVQTGKLLKK